MRSITKFTAVAVSAVLLSSSPLSAQQWNAMPGTLHNTAVSNPNPTRPFWDNKSDDGTNCNVGYILTGVTQPTNCTAVNQRPNSWLPFAGSPVTTYFSADGVQAMAFTFRAGLYRISQLGSLNLGGDIAGANQTWGYFDANGNTVLPNTQNFTQDVLFTSDWGFWITLNRPTGAGVVRSNDLNYADQFAVLGYSNAAFTTSGGVARFNLGVNETLYLGLEDNACATATAVGCTRASDFDNNDVVFSVTSVPEPSTYLLMASGLVGLGLVARRRRA